ncbi:MAG: hypothetical protein JWL77_1779 [Chthonomonadaceae bacterium]|nr:hypothetical protein [Chthonomonadaceae bacterium]
MNPRKSTAHALLSRRTVLLGGAATAAVVSLPMREVTGIRAATSRPSIPTKE